LTAGSTYRSAFPTIIGIAAVVFALDKATKFLVLRHIPLGESWSLFPALARLAKFTFITNTGAAFGMFPQMGALFLVIAILVVVGVVIFYHHLPQSPWVRVSVGLILGGAMGNGLDRILRGYVVDFVDIGFWPIFNIADLSIVMGVSVLAYYLWEEDSKQTPEPPQKSQLSEGRGL
jgi:signal peptidase II